MQTQRGASSGELGDMQQLRGAFLDKFRAVQAQRSASRVKFWNMPLKT